MEHVAEELNTRHSIRFLKNLPIHEKRQFLDSFDHVFCDCDGVIWHTLRNVIPGSAEAIAYLRRIGKRITFVTNNSISSTADQLQKFERSQIKIDKRDLVHPAQSICEYLKSIKFRGPILCLASTPFKDLLREEGFQLSEAPDRIIAEQLQDLRDAVYSHDPVKAVIIDVDFNLSAWKLMRAQVHLRDPQCLLIGGAADTSISFGGHEILGPGLFLKIVEESTKRKAIVLGKPGQQLAEVLKQRYGLRDTAPGRVLFIGDSLSSDVKFGKMCGFQTMLVLTGGTKETDLMQHLPQDQTPDFVAATLADLNNLI